MFNPLNIIKPGTPVYCHTSTSPFEEGKWYEVYEVLPGAGNMGEDLIIFWDRRTGRGKYDRWTIQKDENDLNYENWFHIGDLSFDTNKAFDSLYESEEDDLEWAEELVSNVHNGWSLLKSGFRDYDDYDVLLIIKDKDYLMDSVLNCGENNLIPYLEQPNYRYELKRYRSNDRGSVDCGTYPYDGNDDLDTVLLGYGNDDSFWFLEDWVDLLFVEKLKTESINESENDLEWAEDLVNNLGDITVTLDIVREGDKVVRGKDWHYGEQDRGSVYGIVQNMVDDGYNSGGILETNGNGLTYLLLNDNYWVNVKWVDENGYETNNDHYMIGLDYYTLKFKTDHQQNLSDTTLKESENDLEWVEELYKGTSEIVTSSNAFEGAKVVRGEDWIHGSQDRDSVYGIIKPVTFDDGTRLFKNQMGLTIYDQTSDGNGEKYDQMWVTVDWVDDNGRNTFSNSYRVGPTKFDLKFLV